ncbi:MAG: hypothetical protein C0601_01535 [Candidatus Muiribacterium halophilum]|uniref:Uncharacterized protein n=1 Tax=Muiribacterium halophilum TaxID=2053465 RepID=A0A2N5ZLT0_MUIH1|nr:MAG: hypothetical protein C0601_01535 [Candidatus Muirbacterium halophilum]
MRILSLGKRLDRPEYNDIFKELDKFDDLEFSAVKEHDSNDSPYISIKETNNLFSFFSKEANLSYEKNQLRKILYKFSPEIIEIHAEPHHRLCHDIFLCCNDLGISPSFILYPEKSLKDHLIYPYNNIRKNTLSRTSFIVLRNDSLKDQIKDSAFKNSFRKIPFPAYLIEKRKKDNDICNILISIVNDLSEDVFEDLLSLSDYIQRLKFNIVGNIRIFKKLKKEGFNCDLFEDLSREEIISLLSRTDIVLLDNDSSKNHNTLIPFTFFNKIPCLTTKSSEFSIDITTLDEYKLKKLILGDIDPFVEIINKAGKKAYKDFSAGKCAFETYELYKFLFKTMIR